MAVFLDRDGILNRPEIRDGRPCAPRRLRDFRLLPGVTRGVRALHDVGLLTVVVTNQPDIANGHVEPAVVEAMHERLRRYLPLDAIEMCPHRQEDDCGCRKPRPGLLVGAAARLGIDLSHSFLVGDRWKDIAAGRAVGCHTVFVDRGYAETGQVAADSLVRSFPAAVRRIMALAITMRGGGGRG
jgi:D-glycero-D-manno-heptose 1,7-bisphosphate phosphatase